MLKSGNKIHIKPKREFSFKFRAFTIAEILIVLGIIGIVSMVIIPTIIQRQEEQVAVSKLKKAYATIYQAYISAVQENGTPDTWDLIGENDPVGTENLLNKMVPYLKVDKNCIRGTGCFPEGKYLLLSGGPYTNFDSTGIYGKVILADGTLLAFGVRDKDCLENRGNTLHLSSICAAILVDTNGFKGPNQLGRDAFWFSIAKSGGVLPHGTQEEDENATIDSYPFSTECSDALTNSGRGCTAWVIYNENMDYLHCNDLSWTGKHKCSN